MGRQCQRAMQSAACFPPAPCLYTLLNLGFLVGVVAIRAGYSVDCGITKGHVVIPTGQLIKYM